MKTKIMWVIVLLASWGIGQHLGNSWNSRPIILDCTDTNERKYFITYEVKKGEYREQVKDQVSCRR
jgi:hypothetical protein